MKFESKFKFFIVLLIITNLFYLKIARDIRNDIKSQYKKYEENNPYLNKITTNIEKIPQIIDCNQKEISLTMMDNSEPSKNNNNKNSSESEVVSGLGKSINDGLHPIPIPNNGMLNTLEEIDLKISTNTGNFSHAEITQSNDLSFQIQTESEQSKVRKDKNKGKLSEVKQFIKQIKIYDYIY